MPEGVILMQTSFAMSAVKLLALTISTYRAPLEICYTVL